MKSFLQLPLLSIIHVIFNVIINNDPMALRGDADAVSALPLP